MQLTGKQILERGIVYNHCEAGIQQQGIDVRAFEIYEIVPHHLTEAHIPSEGKTVLPQYQKLALVDNKFMLKAGHYYEVVLMEGVRIPNNASLHFKTRSSLVRCGANVFSGQFDAGFESEHAGCFLHTVFDLTIDFGARIAQAICFESDVVDNLYDGQWQNDKQRQ